ncbi:MAG: hypothetical protein JST59_02635 [Actinobacteria bacterium]|nr:hypothetical protein [Actinomycetota bacterium]
MQLLEGRYANSLVSAIGISETGKFVRINFEKFASVYGVEVNESNQPVTSLCQAKDGRVFLSNGSMLYEFHAKKLRIITEQKIAEKDERIHQIRTNTKGDIVILKEAAHEWVVEFYKQS